MARISITLPLDPDFHLPEGNYRGCIESITSRTQQSGKKPETHVKFVIEVFVPSKGRKKCLAARSFKADLKKGSELRNFLQAWLGEDYFNKTDTDEVDLDGLIGTEVEVTLAHIHVSGHDHPWVLVANIYKTGTLELTEKPKEGKD